MRHRRCSCVECRISHSTVKAKFARRLLWCLAAALERDDESRSNEITVDISMRTNPNRRFLMVVMAPAIFGLLQTGCSKGPVVPDSSSPPSLESPKQAGTPISNASVRPPICPTFGPPTEPGTLPPNGGHRVILSWTASAPADSKHAAAIGYCIYRSMGGKDSPSELLNSAPFPGTSCMDDRVENGKKYYYVVRAISAKGVTSITSKAAPAPIPTGTKTSSSSAKTSVPSCREMATKK
jgi:hypothetical protein